MDGMGWIQLSQDTVQWLFLVNTIMFLLVCSEA
jgi:hypothetical protein